MLHSHLSGVAYSSAFDWQVFLFFCPSFTSSPKGSTSSRYIQLQKTETDFVLVFMFKSINKIRQYY